MYADGKVVLITGASRGIGHATAQHLAQAGYRVYAGVRKATPMENISEVILDVTNSTSIQTAIKQILEKEGRLDIVVNNAGYALVGPIECLTMEEIYAQMDVNFFGVIRVCQEILPHMRKQGSGQIINISSQDAVCGSPYASLYAASKAALESFSEALSIEVLPWNIQVAIVEPGPVATECNFYAKLGQKHVDEAYDIINEQLFRLLQERRQPSDKVQTPAEVAQFLQTVIEDQEPKLRYQTSLATEQVVSLSIKDITGTEFLQRMQAVFLSQKD